MGADAERTAERTEDAPVGDEPASAGLHYPDLTIRGFRAIKDLHVPRLGRVTLITGKNNTGKTSILEALYLHVYGANPRAVFKILSAREESHRAVGDDEWADGPGSLFQVTALFHGFPRLTDDIGSIAVESGQTNLKLDVIWEFYTRGEGVDEETPFLSVETEMAKRIHRLVDFLDGRAWARQPDRRVPCVEVAAHVGERTSVLDNLWSDVLLAGREEDAVEALRIIDPGITGAFMIPTEAAGPSLLPRPRAERAVFVRSESFEQPVPLRTLGDGMHRLFVIVLSLLSARGGILLIDEFENGLHHTAQADAWRMIFRLARDLDVQVFATTHSWDAVESFAAAANESPEDGALLRLTRRGDDIIPTVLTEDDLAIAAYERIEVR